MENDINCEPEHGRISIDWQAVKKRLYKPLLMVLSFTIVSWWAGFLNAYLPSPERTMLWLGNIRRGEAQSAVDRFRVVLCWLENDPSGDNTRNVAQAFTSIEGITLVRSARIVAASGAADGWRKTMRKEARAVLEDWAADLALVGVAKQPGKALSLWFVPRSGEGTLTRGDQPYELENATLGLDFHKDYRAEITAAALVAISPLAESETHGRVLEKGLVDATDKLATLLKASAATEPDDRRARLQLSLGNALRTLGERESGTERLEQAVAAFHAALKELTRERVPLDWATTKTNLGNALVVLGGRESGTERLEQAVAAYRDALKVRTRERVPLGWAMTQNNLGHALRILGARESGTERLEQAVAAFHAALKERTREREPLDWAATKNGLGNALVALGGRESGTERLEQAVAAYRDSLREHTRERVPLGWAMTQNNLGHALGTLGERESGTERLEQAVAAFHAALKELTRERVPLDWATTKTGLGKALVALGGRESGTERLEQAVAAYRDALKVRTRERVPLGWAGIQDGLGACPSDPGRAGEWHRAAGTSRGRLPQRPQGAYPQARAVRLGRDAKRPRQCPFGPGPAGEWHRAAGTSRGRLP